MDNGIAWRDFIQWAFGNAELRREFEKSTGTPRLGTSPLDVLIDQATGFQPDYFKKFVFCLILRLTYKNIFLPQICFMARNLVLGIKK